MNHKEAEHQRLEREVTKAAKEWYDSAQNDWMLHKPTSKLFDAVDALNAFEAENPKVDDTK